MVRRTWRSPRRDLPLKVIERQVEPRKINLKGARVIVAGGGGVGSRDNFKLIHELAGAIGGAVGASRAAVDGGYISKDHQVGQTGTTVRPALYIACGISGAVQHRAGMEESAKIIAINTDAEAPIFSVAHYGIVGDLNKVIPLMVKALRERPAVRAAAGCSVKSGTENGVRTLDRHPKVTAVPGSPRGEFLSRQRRHPVPV